MLVLCEMCFEGVGVSWQGGLRCWHCVKCVFRAWGQLKRGFEVLVLFKIYFLEGMGVTEKGVRGVGIG